MLATVAHWFGPSKRGLIFGIWNAHLNVGNIAGAAVAGHFVDTDWGLSFIVPGIIIACTGILVFLFLIPSKCSIDTVENYQSFDSTGAEPQAVCAVFCT